MEVNSQMDWMADSSGKERIARALDGMGCRRTRVVLTECPEVLAGESIASEWFTIGPYRRTIKELLNTSEHEWTRVDTSHDEVDFLWFRAWQRYEVLLCLGRSLWQGQTGSNVSLGTQRADAEIFAAAWYFCLWVEKIIERDVEKGWKGKNPSGLTRKCTKMTKVHAGAEVPQGCQGHWKLTESGQILCFHCSVVSPWALDGRTSFWNSFLFFFIFFLSTFFHIFSYLFCFFFFCTLHFLFVFSALFLFSFVFSFHFWLWQALQAEVFSAWHVHGRFAAHELNHETMEARRTWHDIPRTHRSSAV